MKREPPKTKDPDSAGRGAAAHNKTQNEIAESVRALGWLPRSPKADEPDFDIAWRAGKTVCVCEVKSLTQENEERQLRMAIGQVIRYRQKMNAAGHEPVKAVIATEIEPRDESWNALCEEHAILLVWPSVAAQRLEQLVSS